MYDTISYRPQKFELVSMDGKASIVFIFPAHKKESHDKEFKETEKTD